MAAEQLESKRLSFPLGLYTHFHQMLPSAKQLPSAQAAGVSIRAGASETGCRPTPPRLPRPLSAGGLVPFSVQIADKSLQCGRDPPPPPLGSP